MYASQRRVGRISVWSGNPDCDALETALRAHVSGTVPAQLPPGTVFGNAHFGNLGESLAFLIGRSNHHALPQRCLGMNCAMPLGNSSRTGLDILWIAFDPKDETADRAWIQEVKTTGDAASARYITELKADYGKLFGEAVSLSLEARLGEAAFHLENLVGDSDLARRTRALGARSPEAVTRVVLEPTGVHEMGVDAISVMEDVRHYILNDLNWPPHLVDAHLIELSDLWERLARVAT